MKTKVTIDFVSVCGREPLGEPQCHPRDWSAGKVGFFGAKCETERIETWAEWLRQKEGRKRQRGRKREDWEKTRWRTLFELREEYGVFYGFSQGTMSFYFPLFKCQGRLTKTSRGATALFPASAKHDASNEFLGDPSSRAVIFAGSLVPVVVARRPFQRPITRLPRSSAEIAWNFLCQLFSLYSTLPAKR